MKKQNKNIDVTNTFLLVILMVTIIANGVENHKAKKKFNWDTSVISTKANPVQVSSCIFNGNYYKIDKNVILNDGWNKENNSENSIQNTFFPDSLFITWFSYNEQKFYDGSFALPKEMILKKALQMGMIPSKNSNSILKFTAEVQPKGKLAVWIRNLDQNDKETRFKIDTYQAKEIKTTWHIFDDHTENDTTSHISISNRVALVLEPHSYKLDVKLPKGYFLKESYFRLYNQTIWRFNEDEPVFNFLPENFDLTWENGSKAFTTQFSFDENEVLNSFRKENNSADLVLKLIINNHNSAVKVVLKNTKTNSEVIFKDKYESQDGSSIIRLNLYPK